jgi:membrane protein required for colicin V production
MPVAIVVAPRLLPFASAGPLDMQSWGLIVVVFLATGIALGAAFRFAINEAVGPDVGIGDRAAGAALGAVRVLLVAVLLVLVFDRIIPPNLQPQFLATSRLRPVLLVAGQQGLRTLPPEMANYIDRVKQQHGI